MASSSFGDIAKSTTAPHRDVLMARVLLLSTQGIDKETPADLIVAIEAYLAANNADPKPLVWTAAADQILTKVRRGRVALEQL
jgi:hypothetical protein